MKKLKNKNVFIDGRYNNYHDYFLKKGFKVNKTIKHAYVYQEVSFHPDIHMCFDVYRKNFFICNNLFDEYLAKIEKRCYNIYKGSKLGKKYPNNIKFNCMISKDYLIHNIKNTDKTIMDVAKKIGLEIIDVKQGYTKCSMVNYENQFLTDDIGIYKKLKKHQLDILYIKKGFVKLEGLEYGFIGGATGVCENKIYFTGDIKDIGIKNEIVSFYKNCEIVFLSDFEISDIGSIFFY